MPLTINNLSQDAIQRLTYVLRLLPDIDPLEYSNWVLSSIKALPAPLKRKSRLSSLFSIASQKSHICQLHYLLNFPLVDALCKLLTLECSGRMKNLVVNAPLLPANQQARIQRIQECHQLCMHTDLYFNTLLPEASSKSLFQTNKCPACCITRLASHPEFLLDLLVITRSRHDKRPATIIRYLDSFLSFYTKHLDSQTFMKLFAAVEEETADLRACRRILHRIRIESGAKEGEPLQQLSSSKEQANTSSLLSTSTRIEPKAEPYDSVLSIVNLYDGLRSSHPLSLDYAALSTQPGPFPPSPSLLCNVSSLNLDSGYNTASLQQNPTISSSDSAQSSRPKSNHSSDETLRASCSTLVHRKTAYRALVGAEDSVVSVATRAIARQRGNGGGQSETQRTEERENGKERASTRGGACADLSPPSTPRLWPMRRGGNILTPKLVNTGFDTDTDTDGAHSLPRPPSPLLPPTIPALTVSAATSPRSNASSRFPQTLSQSLSVSHNPRSNASSVYSQSGLSTYGADVPLHLLDSSNKLPPLPQAPIHLHSHSNRHRHRRHRQQQQQQQQQQQSHIQSGEPQLQFPPQSNPTLASSSVVLCPLATTPSSSSSSDSIPSSMNTTNTRSAVIDTRSRSRSQQDRPERPWSRRWSTTMRKNKKLSGLGIEMQP